MFSVGVLRLFEGFFVMKVVRKVLVTVVLYNVVFVCHLPAVSFERSKNMGFAVCLIKYPMSYPRLEDRECTHNWMSE